MKNMFLDLSQDVQHRIYDMLRVKDRFRLNCALPKASRISKTSRTNTKKDKTLALVTCLFKKQKIDPSKIPENILLFLKQNVDQPTVQHLVEAYNLASQVHVQDFSPIDHKEAILHQIRNDTLQAHHVAAIQNIDVRFVNQVLSALTCYGTPSTYDIVFTIPHFMDVCMESTCHGGSFVFNLINVMNVPLLKHLHVHRIQQFVAKAMEYINTPTIARIYGNSPNKVQLMLQYCNLTFDAKEAILEEAINVFNEETIWMMLEAI